MSKMIIYLYLFLPLLFLPTDSSSIKTRANKNDLEPQTNLRSGLLRKDIATFKKISHEPFMVQLPTPKFKESNLRGNKGTDLKGKKPRNQRLSKLKNLGQKQRRRRDLSAYKAKRERKQQNTENIKPVITTEKNLRNTTGNTINKSEIIKALSSYPKRRETKKNKPKEEFSFDIRLNDTEKVKSLPALNLNLHKHLRSSADKAPFVKMVYPSTPKFDRHPHKYTYKDLMADRERLEQKIKYIRNLLSTNDSNSDDIIRIRRRSESDKTANKIAKMFLTLSAVNGLYDKRKSDCHDSEEDVKVQDVWEKERKSNPIRRNSSSNEERYKVKKWIEYLKNKRSSSKTCPCMAGQGDDGEAFPLEQKLPKGYFLVEKARSSEESSESYKDPVYSSRDKLGRNSNFKRRNFKNQDDPENKLKALSKNGKKKLELPMDDLELYRSRAKQILRNAEEILDKIKEEEERRLSAPTTLLSHLKELTARIQGDPRNHENELIRKIQKNLGWGPLAKSQDAGEGNTFVDNMKSFILDPYEKAKALTDESTKKLSSYLLRNLGKIQDSSEEARKDDDETDRENVKVYYGRVPQTEEKPLSASLANEYIPKDALSKQKEDLQNWENTISALLKSNTEDEDKIKEEKTTHAEEEFKQRMNDMIKEQQKKVNEYQVTHSSEESEELEYFGNKEQTDGLKLSKLGKEKLKDTKKLNENNSKEKTDDNVESVRYLEDLKKSEESIKDKNVKQEDPTSEIIETENKKLQDETLNETHGEEFTKIIDQSIKEAQKPEDNLKATHEIIEKPSDEENEKIKPSENGKIFRDSTENDRGNEEVVESKGILGKKGELPEKAGSVKSETSSEMSENKKFQEKPDSGLKSKAKEAEMQLKEPNEETIKLKEKTLHEETEKVKPDKNYETSKNSNESNNEDVVEAKNLEENKKIEQDVSKMIEKDGSEEVREEKEFEKELEEIIKAIDKEDEQEKEKQKMAEEEVQMKPLQKILQNVQEEIEPKDNEKETEKTRDPSDKNSETKSKTNHKEDILSSPRNLSDLYEEYSEDTDEDAVEMRNEAQDKLEEAIFRALEEDYLEKKEEEKDNDKTMAKAQEEYSNEKVMKNQELDDLAEKELEEQTEIKQTPKNENESSESTQLTLSESNDELLKESANNDGSVKQQEGDTEKPEIKEVLLEQKPLQSTLSRKKDEETFEPSQIALKKNSTVKDNFSPENQNSDESPTLKSTNGNINKEITSEDFDMEDKDKEAMTKVEEQKLYKSSEEGGQMKSLSGVEKLVEEVEDLINKDESLLKAALNEQSESKEDTLAETLSQQSYGNKERVKENNDEGENNEISSGTLMAKEEIDGLQNQTDNDNDNEKLLLKETNLGKNMDFEDKNVSNVHDQIYDNNESVQELKLDENVQLKEGGITSPEYENTDIDRSDSTENIKEKDDKILLKFSKHDIKEPIQKVNEASEGENSMTDQTAEEIPKETEMVNLQNNADSIPEKENMSSTENVSIEEKETSQPENTDVDIKFLKHQENGQENTNEYLNQALNQNAFKDSKEDILESVRDVINLENLKDQETPSKLLSVEEKTLAKENDNQITDDMMKETLQEIYKAKENLKNIEEKLIEDENLKNTEDEVVETPLQNKNYEEIVKDDTNPLKSVNILDFGKEDQSMDDVSSARINEENAEDQIINDKTQKITEDKENVKTPLEPSEFETVRESLAQEEEDIGNPEEENLRTELKSEETLLKETDRPNTLASDQDKNIIDEKLSADALGLENSEDVLAVVHEKNKNAEKDISGIASRAEEENSEEKLEESFKYGSSENSDEKLEEETPLQSLHTQTINNRHQNSDGQLMSGNEEDNLKTNLDNEKTGILNLDDEKDGTDKFRETTSKERVGNTEEINLYSKENSDETVEAELETEKSWHSNEETHLRNENMEKGNINESKEELNSNSNESMKENVKLTSDSFNKEDEIKSQERTSQEDILELSQNPKENEKTVSEMSKEEEDDQTVEAKKENNEWEESQELGEFNLRSTLDKSLEKFDENYSGKLQKENNPETVAETYNVKEEGSKSLIDKDYEGNESASLRSSNPNFNADSNETTEKQDKLNEDFKLQSNAQSPLESLGLDNLKNVEANSYEKLEKPGIVATQGMKPKSLEVVDDNDSDETLMARESNEIGVDNIIDYDTPLQSIMKESNNQYSEEYISSEEAFREDDLSNLIDHKKEDDSLLRSMNYDDSAIEHIFDSDEVSSFENRSNEDEENELALKPHDHFHVEPFAERHTDSDASTVKLSELNKPFDSKKLKIPKSIGQIMKDLGKEDVFSMENLNLDKIDHVLGKINEAQHQHLLGNSENDCRKQCACADEIDTQSRKIGRYEIAKDFLQWMKDLQLNRVLSDD